MRKGRDEGETRGGFCGLRNCFRLGCSLPSLGRRAPSNGFSSCVERGNVADMKANDMLILRACITPRRNHAGFFEFLGVVSRRRWQCEPHVPRNLIKLRIKNSCWGGATKFVAEKKLI